MNPNKAILLIITITFCLAFIMWGTIIVVRQINDVNYHTPTNMEVYKDCMNGSGYSPNSGDCKAMAGVK